MQTDDEPQVIEEKSLFSKACRFMNAQHESPHEEMESALGLLQKQIACSALTVRFCVVLALAAFIASLGLMIDSSVIIIGAMLIAPLMRPIISLAYGLVILNWQITLRSILTCSAGILVILFVTWLAEYIFGLREPTQELLIRTQPSLVDLGVAVAAGFAATMAVNRPNVADSLPGVAVSVALLPPLCVVGLSISIGYYQEAMGAMTLFLINMAAIVLCAIFVFVLDGYGRLKGALPGMALMILLLYSLSPALLHSMEELSANDEIQEVMVKYLREHYTPDGTVHPKDLTQVVTKIHEEHVSAFIELKAPFAHFDQAQFSEIYTRISALFEMPLNLKIQSIVTEEVVIYPDQQSGGIDPEYGMNEPVPRKATPL